MDTWIGGDDGDNYYFDYDSSNKVVLKKAKANTFKFTLKKNKNDYYQISSAADWKQAATNLDKNYKLTKDISFSTSKYYMLGSEHNVFTGNFDGDNKTVSNVTINASVENRLGILKFGCPNEVIRHVCFLVCSRPFSGMFSAVIGLMGVRPSLSPDALTPFRLSVYMHAKRVRPSFIY